MSFSIYMVHFLVCTLINAGSRLMEKLMGQQLRTDVRVDGRMLDVLDLSSPWLMDGLALAYLVLVVLLAGVTHKYVELPGQEWVKSLALRWSSPRAASVA